MLSTSFSSHALVAVSHLPQSSLVKSCYFCCTYIILEIFPKYKSGSFNSGCVHHHRGVYGQASQPHSSLTSLSSQESHLSINEQNPILIGKSTWQSGGQCFVPSNQFDLPVPFIWINSRQTSPNSSGQIKCQFSSSGPHVLSRAVARGSLFSEAEEDERDLNCGGQTCLCLMASKNSLGWILISLFSSASASCHGVVASCSENGWNTTLTFNMESNKFLVKLVVDFFNLVIWSAFNLIESLFFKEDFNFQFSQAQVQVWSRSKIKDLDLGYTLN